MMLTQCMTTVIVIGVCITGGATLSQLGPEQTAPASPVGITVSQPEPATTPNADPGDPKPALEPAKTPPAENRPAAKADGDWDSIKTDVLRKWDKLRAFSGILTAKSDFGSPEHRVLARNRGRYDYLKKDDGTALIRMDMSNLTVTRQPQGDNMAREGVFTLRDGDHVYVVTDQHGQKSAVKHGPDALPKIHLGGRNLLERLDTQFDLEVQPSEILNGRPVYVLKCTTKQGKERIMYYLDKETGLAIKISGENENLGSSTTVTLTDLDSKATFPKDHFVFVPPEGVVVRDTTIPQPPEDLPPTQEGAAPNSPANDK